VPRTDDEIRAAIARGAREHYVDAELYDHEYRRRRFDVRWYRGLAEELDAGELLELGCGSGRLTVPLARDGRRVVGVDLSADMLKRLGERLEHTSAAVRARVEVRRADFRSLALHRRFPLVICPFNTFMHLYTRDDVERFLAVVRAHLRRGGTFAFDVMNPDLRWLSRDPERRWARTKFRHPRTGEPMIYTTNLLWDGPLQVAFMRIFYARAGRPRDESVVALTHRYFFPLELEALLHYNGFRVEHRYGDFDGAELETASEQQVLVCRAR
jgi:SAM-dependent methyltransferase